MIRQFIIIALVAVGFWLARRLWRRSLAHRRQWTDPGLPYQAMVRCAHCGLHVPRIKAVGDPREGYYCSEEHRRIQQTPQDNR